MSLFIASLNSGSNGNCYYVGNGSEAVLVDVGISCRETERRMARLGLSLHDVKAILVSHEHTDHISGVRVLSRKYKLPVYITEKTLFFSGLQLEPELVRTFNPYEPLCFGELTVHPFPKNHDASEPHSFVVSGNGINIGVFTDIGSVCDHLVRHFRQCHAVFLETNYDVTLLEQGRYPYMLKKRISGPRGHLSNHQALELFLAHRSPFLSHVLFSHLSADNNHPERILELFAPHAGSTHISVAPRTGETEVFHIRATETATPPVRFAEPTAAQLSLFG